MRTGSISSFSLASTSALFFGETICGLVTEMPGISFSTSVTFELTLVVAGSLFKVSTDVIEALRRFPSIVSSSFWGNTSLGAFDGVFVVLGSLPSGSIT